ncbi:MAG: hypothetical protein R2724_09595 [Bryobacterales bacterium]
MLDRISFLREIKNLAYKGVEALAAGEIDDFGRLLNQGWALKKQLASRISNDALDEMYCKALKAGAIGGKIADAPAAEASCCSTPQWSATTTSAAPSAI